MNFKERCKEQINRAIAKKADNKFYQSLKVQFQVKGYLTAKQFEAINKF
jgi:hypothetical protein